MARLIDADKLMERFRIVAQSGGPVVVHVSDICAAIEDEACEESLEVVHGRGLDVRETEMHVPELKRTSKKTAETCSASRVRINFIGAERRLFAAICPTCGAIMPEV